MKGCVAASVLAVLFAVLAMLPSVQAGEDSWRPYHESSYSKHESKGQYVLLGFMDDNSPTSKTHRSALAPILLESAYSNITPYRVSMGTQPGLENKFGVTTFPTVVLVRNGKVVDRISGIITEEQLRKLLAKAK